MTNRKTSNLDRLRTKAWATTVACAAGEHSPTLLERLLHERLGTEIKDVSGVWRRYLSGTTKPFFKHEVNPKAEWVSAAEKIYPNSSRWFYSPIWYLLEDAEFLPSEVLACVRLLPQGMRDKLLLVGGESTTPSFLLAENSNYTILELSRNPSTWSLGAMACIMRRAELAGDLPIFRKAGISILWHLEQLLEREPEPLQAVLVQLVDRVKKGLDRQIYPGTKPETCPVIPSDLESFESEVGHWRPIDLSFCRAESQSQITVETLLPLDMDATRLGRSVEPHLWMADHQTL